MVYSLARLVQDIQKVIGQYPEQLKYFSGTLLLTVVSISGGILQFIFFLIITVVLALGYE